MTEQLQIPFGNANTKKMGGMIYRLKEGRWVADHGICTIDGVRHGVTDGFVVCDPTKNRRAWGTTEAKGDCEQCKRLLPYLF